MYGPDVLANRNDLWSEANELRFLEATASPVAKEPLISSRDPTPALFEHDDATYDRIVLRFGDPLNNALEGIQFGTHALADVFLGSRGTMGVSARHGTAVGYEDEKKDEVRKCDTWILSYAPGQQKRWHDITVHVGGLGFKINFPNHEAASPEYMSNLSSFRERCKSAVPPIDAVDLNSSNPSTTAPSQARTPSKRALYLDDGLIGKDSPATKKRDKKRKRDDPVWVAWSRQIRRAYELMKNNPHPNMVPVHDFQDTKDGPSLVMPYYELGNLKDLGPVSEDLCVKVLLDLLLGLSHLHRRGVIHRDLKLENLLVEKPFNIIIADFGLSKFAEDKLFTKFCASAESLAPEVFPGVQASYGPKADVWSAAILLMTLYLSRLPKPPKIPSFRERRKLRSWSQEWSNILLRTLHDEDENEDQVIDILRYMLEPDPKKRYSADECLARGCSNGLFRMNGNGHVVVATETTPEDDGAQTLRPVQRSEARWTAEAASKTIGPVHVKSF
ncbi:MAG: hypothetical protein M1816_004954 [Peltula sp. TS41687]|nr:MAG: hypothetical protein M1816_004954 [Peltula sp. TS41687]